MARIAEVFVDIKARTTQLKAGVQSALSTVKKAAAAMAAAFLVVIPVIRRIGRAIVEVIKAFSEQELVEKRLRGTLKAFGDEVEENSKHLFQRASAIQQMTTLGDEQVLSLFAQARALGVQVDQVDLATKAAIGLSAALGQDVRAMQRYVALALQGEFTMLRRYIPALRQMTDEQEQLDEVLRVAAAGFEVAREESDTVSGRFKQFKNATSDLKQEVGRLLNELLKVDDVFLSLTNSITVFTRTLASNLDLIGKALEAIKITVVPSVIGPVPILAGKPDFGKAAGLFGQIATNFAIAQATLRSGLSGLGDGRGQRGGAELFSGVGQISTATGAAKVGQRAILVEDRQVKKEIEDLERILTAVSTAGLFLR